MKKEYKKNFIANFIVRFDFECFNEGINVETISKSFEKKYPLVETKNIQDHQIVIDNSEKINIPKIEPTKIIHEVSMLNAEQNSRIIISNLAFIYETSKYTEFSKIKEEIVSVINILESQAQIKNYSRFGIRYINMIKMPCKNKKDILDWSKYIDPVLLESKKMFDGQNDLLQMIQIHNILSSKNSEIIYTLQTGIPNNNFPATLMEKNFLIDIDGYSKSLMDKEEILSLFDDVHNEEKEIFEKCITDELRRYMDE